MNEMISCWRREDDDVITTSGRPSWLSLVKALEEEGHNGVAARIKSGMSSKLIFRPRNCLNVLPLLQISYPVAKGHTAGEEITRYTCTLERLANLQ